MYFNSTISFGFFSFFSRICQRYIAVREPHRQAYKQVVNVEYETICSDGLSCKKTRPSYRTIFRTVYRTAYKCSSDLEEKQIHNDDNKKNVVCINRKEKRKGKRKAKFLFANPKKIDCRRLRKDLGKREKSLCRKILQKYWKMESVIGSQTVFPQCCAEYTLKFSFSEKTTKIWRNRPQDFDVTW